MGGESRVLVLGARLDFEENVGLVARRRLGADRTPSGPGPPLVSLKRLSRLQFLAFYINIIT